MKKKLILDVDPGGDDAVAILLAAHHPDAELVGLVVGYGNAEVSVTLTNTFRVLEARGLWSVRVYAGAMRPMRPVSGGLVSIPSAQEAYLPLPPGNFDVLQPKSAHEFLAEYYLGPDGPNTTYVASGPFTNLARALLFEPRLAKRIPRVVTSAGAYYEGNQTPSAEFNVWADPDAAKIVFNAGIPITMLGLEALGSAKWDGIDDDLAKSSSPVSQLVAKIIKFMYSVGWRKGEIYDPGATAAAIQPSILTTKKMHVDVEVQGELTRGRTVADVFGWFPDKTPNADVATAIDRDLYARVIAPAFPR